jgi:hypothetical protein
MEDNMVQKVKKWVQLDNKIEVKKCKLKLVADERREVEDEILEYVQDQDKSNLHIRISDGHIEFFENRTQQPMTIKFIKDMVHAYFDAHTDNPDPAKELTAAGMIDYILSNRDTRKKLVMRRHMSSPETVNPNESPCP